jgi:exodeoxyribonuclease VII large subunit
VARLRERAEGEIARLDALSPLAVMSRGYGIVQDAQGRLVRSVDQVRTGDVIDVRLKDGALGADVREVRKVHKPSISVNDNRKRWD